jgi:hypothetical protein
MRPQDMNFAAKQILKRAHRGQSKKKEQEEKKKLRERFFFERAQTEVCL